MAFGNGLDRKEKAQEERALEEELARDEQTREEQAFARLQTLVDMLPAMEEKGRVLARARKAQEIVKLARKVHFERIEFEDLLKQEKKAMDAAMEARDEGASQEVIGQRNRELFYWGTMKGYKAAPMQNDEFLLKKALEEAGFANEEEAQAAVLPEDELQALADEVEAYQQDYAETLELCESFEEESEC